MSLQDLCMYREALQIRRPKNTTDMTFLTLLLGGAGDGRAAPERQAAVLPVAHWEVLPAGQGGARRTYPRQPLTLRWVWAAWVGP